MSVLWQHFAFRKDRDKMVKQESVTKKEFVVALPEADQKPLFPPDYVSLMTYKGFEVLRAYLEKTHAKPEAIQLLDELVVLCSWKRMSERQMVTWVENQGMVEALGSLVYQIMALDGLGALRVD
jgi:hypothetical protein